MPHDVFKSHSTSPSQQVISRKFASGWFWGLVPPSTVSAEQEWAEVARIFAKPGRRVVVRPDHIYDHPASFFRVEAKGMA